MGKRELKWQKSQGNKLSPSDRLSSFVRLYVLSKLVEEVINRRNDPHTCWAISAIVSCAPEKFQVSSRVFEPMTSVMLVQCSNEWSYVATQMWAGQFVGLVFLWKEWLVRQNINVCEVWLKDEMKKWSSHLLDNLSYCLMSTWKLSGVFNWIQTQDLCDAVEEVININIRAFIIISYGLEVWLGKGLVIFMRQKWFATSISLLEKQPSFLVDIVNSFYSTILKIFSVCLHLINFLMLLLVMLTLFPSLESSY